jgi:integrase
MAKLLENTITRLSVSRGKRDAYAWDSTLPGFGVRAFASGKKSYVVKYQIASQQRKMSLGPALPGTLAETRKKAQDILASARLGRDIAGEKRTARERKRKERTIGDLIRDFLAIKRLEVRPTTYREVERHLLELFAPLHSRQIETIGRRDIVEIIDVQTKAGKRVQADRCKTSAVTFFNWCIERDYLQANPAAGIKRRTPDDQIERDRVLSMNELALIWRAAAGETDYYKIIRLLILTGARADEIGQLAWGEINLESGEIRLPAERMKNRREHRIFLSQPAIEIVSTIPRRADKRYAFGRTENYFSGWSKAKAKLDELLPVEMRAYLADEEGEPILDAGGKAKRNPKSWRHHDLRRSLATNASDLGLASTVVIEMALGHWSGEKKGIVKTYNRSTHDADRRQLMDNWAQAVLKEVGDFK